MAGPVPTTFEITSDMVGGHYCIVRQTIAAGCLFWPHVHVNEDQVLVVIKGQLGVRVGEREWTAIAGEIVYRPKGVPHTVWNATTETVEMLEITSPGGFDRYFAAQGEMTASGNFDKREQLLREYQISGVDGWAEDLERRYGVHK